MKKAITTLSLLLGIISISYSQVAITTDGSLPDNSAMLDVKSTDKGVLVPRMTEAERNAITNPSNGLLVYVTTNEQFYYNAGTAASPNWTTIGGDDNDWLVSENNMSSSVTGNVGIGTTNAPYEKLQVYGGNFSISNEGTDAYIEIISDEQSDATASYIWTEDAKGFAIGSVPGTPQVLINSFSGNVGIATDNPNEKLEVNGSIRMTDGNEGAGKVMVSDANGTASWADASAIADDDWETFGPNLYHTGGNVGIETNVPSHRLTVDGDIRAYDKIISGFGSNSEASYRFGYGTENTGFSSPTTNAVSVVNNGTESIRVAANGNVGIGITSPGAKLEVAGQVKITGGNPGDGKVLTSDAAGVATWEDISDGVLGIDDLLDAKTNFSSIFLGAQSGLADDGSNWNTGVGVNAMHTNVDGKNNTAVGQSALYNNSSGSNNTSLGHLSMAQNTTGFSNVAIGVESLSRNTDRSNLVAVGDSSLYWNGFGASFSGHATMNTAVGSKALYSNTIGYENTGNGYNALYSNTTGNYNVANGGKALYYNIDGNRNTANGYKALYINSNGCSNTANGSYALSYNNGSDNTATGSSALVDNENGSDNTASGSRALTTNIDGNNNTANGSEALPDNRNGSYNTASGSKALYYHRNGDYNTALGYWALGAGIEHTNCSALGYNAQPGSSNKVAIGNTSVTWIGGNVEWETYSKSSAKGNIKEDVKGLDFIMDLRPVTYHIDKDEMDRAIGVVDSSDYAEKYDIEKIKQTGFLAEEILQAANKSGYYFSGVTTLKEETGLYSIAYSKFVVPLVKAVQEQNEIIEAYEEKFISQEDKMELLMDRLEKLEKSLK
ncbi:MAG: hypothetical protein DRJ05_03290 [Bacteroidetes bacterium]|nr:MAG: hypothetical protein DRJ05_03290 [Bacteroidota bacterium]